MVAFSSYFRRLFSKGTSEGRKLVWNWITHVHLRTNLKAELTVVVVVMMLLLLAVVMWCILWGRFLLTHRILRTKWRRRIECKIGYIQGGFLVSRLLSLCETAVYSMMTSSVSVKRTDKINGNRISHKDSKMSFFLSFFYSTSL